MFFILTLVVKSNNDRKKFEVFNEIETTNKLIQKKTIIFLWFFIFSNSVLAKIIEFRITTIMLNKS